jgi:arsenate reductase
MAESYFNQFSDGTYIAESAGIEPGVLNPLVVEALKEDGIDISGKQTYSAFDFYKEGRLYSYVITVCDKEAAQRCPFFPGVTQRLQWSFKDPSTLTGTKEEKLQAIREIRDQIKKQIKTFLEGLEK